MASKRPESEAPVKRSAAKTTSSEAGKQYIVLSGDMAGLTKLHCLLHLDGLTLLDSLKRLQTGYVILDEAQGAAKPSQAAQRPNAIFEESLIRFLTQGDNVEADFSGLARPQSDEQDEQGTTDDWDKIKLAALQILQADMDRQASEHVAYIRDRLKSVLDNV